MRTSSFAELSWLIALRKQQPAIYNGEAEFIGIGNPHLFGYVRQGSGRAYTRLCYLCSITSESHLQWRLPLLAASLG